MGATGLVKAVPGLVDMARRIYETENIGFRALAERVGIEYPRLFTLAKRQGGVKYAAFVHDVAQQVGDEIMAEAMKRKRQPGRPVNGKREFKPSGVPGAKRPRTSLTPLQQKVQQARALYESGEGGSKAEIARK